MKLVCHFVTSEYPLTFVNKKRGEILLQIVVLVTTILALTEVTWALSHAPARTRRIYI
jgi:hypothetical protein